MSIWLYSLLCYSMMMMMMIFCMSQIRFTVYEELKLVFKRVVSDDYEGVGVSKKAIGASIIDNYVLSCHRQQLLY